MEDLSGKRLGPYQVLGPLGEGGMAAVYKAFQPGVERNVALKILPRVLAKDEQFVARFEREARVLANLQHPHILPVFDYGQEDGYTYITMPMVKSGTLSQLLKQGEPLPLAQIEKLIGQIGDALDYAHGQGIVHRDIKPSNVLLDERGNCLLTDFGIAKRVEASDNKLAATGGIIGTPSYMSPEQGSGGEIDRRSDIYSLGIILYEMATGRVPFKAETPLAVMIKHLNDPLPLPRQVNPNLPEAVEQVILKALAKNPDHRFQSAGEMIAALKRAVTGQMADRDMTMVSSGSSRTAVPAAAPAATPESKPRAGGIPGWAYAVAAVLIVAGLGCGGLALALSGSLGGLMATPTVAAQLLLAEATETEAEPAGLAVEAGASTSAEAPVEVEAADEPEAEQATAEAPAQVESTPTPLPTNTAVPTDTPAPTVATEAYPPPP
ncbi:MAG TPA: protein kinase, partial [Anaerolineae bacterium]|nr:protein kinase [Anaerolineae bacterium]